MSRLGNNAAAPPSGRGRVLFWIIELDGDFLFLRSGVRVEGREEVHYSRVVVEGRGLRRVAKKAREIERKDEGD